MKSRPRESFSVLHTGLCSFCHCCLEHLQHLMALWYLTAASAKRALTLFQLELRKRKAETCLRGECQPLMQRSKEEAPSVTSSTMLCKKAAKGGHNRPEAKRHSWGQPCYDDTQGGDTSIWWCLPKSQQMKTSTRSLNSYDSWTVNGNDGEGGL